MFSADRFRCLLGGHVVAAGLCLCPGLRRSRVGRLWRTLVGLRRGHPRSSAGRTARLPAPGLIQLSTVTVRVVTQSPALEAERCPTLKTKKIICYVPLWGRSWFVPCINTKSEENSRCLIYLNLKIYPYLGYKYKCFKWNLSDMLLRLIWNYSRKIFLPSSSESALSLLGS